jgi:Zn-dependent protease
MDFERADGIYQRAIEVLSDEATALPVLLSGPDGPSSEDGLKIAGRKLHRGTAAEAAPAPGEQAVSAVSQTLAAVVDQSIKNGEPGASGDGASIDWRRQVRPESVSLPPNTVSQETLLANALLCLGIRQQKIGHFENAAQSFERAALMNDNLYGAVNLESASCYYLAALLNVNSAGRKEAYYRKALSIYETLQIPEYAPRITDCLAGLAYWISEQNRNEEAHEMFAAAIDSLLAHGEKVPLLLQLGLAKASRGAELRARLKNVCQLTQRKLPQLAGLPNTGKQILSLLISVGFFWYVMGSATQAILFLLLLLAHEMGHYVAAGQVGVAVSRPVFTPLGAFITLLSLPASAKDEAYFSFAGPLVGTVAAYIALFFGIVFGSYELCGAAKYAFVLNLFNLIPLAPMDGGRISMAISRRMWFIGLLLFLAVGVAIIYYTIFPVDGSSAGAQRWSLFPLKLFIIYYMLRNGWRDLKDREAMAKNKPEYFKLSWRVRLGYTLSYLGLGSLLFVTLGYLFDDDLHLPQAPRS